MIKKRRRSSLVILSKLKSFKSRSPTSNKISYSESSFLDFYYGRRLIYYKIVILFNSISQFFLCFYSLIYKNTYTNIKHLMLYQVMINLNIYLRFLCFLIFVVFLILANIDCIVKNKFLFEYIFITLILTYFILSAFINAIGIELFKFLNVSGNSHRLLSSLIGLYGCYRVRFYIHVMLSIISVLFFFFLSFCFINNASDVFDLVIGFAHYVIIVVIGCWLSYTIECTYRKVFINNLILKNIQKKKEEEKLRELKILYNIFPTSLVSLVKKRRNYINYHKKLPILLSDIKNFSKWSSDISSVNLINILDKIYSIFDDVCLAYDLEKIKTIGDSYFCTNLVDESTAKFRICIAAYEMVQKFKQFMIESDLNLSLRTGVSRDEGFVCLLGSHFLTFDCFGVSVIKAQEMESTALENEVQVTKKLRNSVIKSIKKNNLFLYDIDFKKYDTRYYINRAAIKDITRYNTSILSSNCSSNSNSTSSSSCFSSDSSHTDSSHTSPKTHFLQEDEIYIMENENDDEEYDSDMETLETPHSHKSERSTFQYFCGFLGAYLPQKPSKEFASYAFSLVRDYNKKIPLFILFFYLRFIIEVIYYFDKVKTKIHVYSLMVMASLYFIFYIVSTFLLKYFYFNYFFIFFNICYSLLYFIIFQEIDRGIEVDSGVSINGILNVYMTFIIIIHQLHVYVKVVVALISIIIVAIVRLYVFRSEFVDKTQIISDFFLGDLALISILFFGAYFYQLGQEVLYKKRKIIQNKLEILKDDVEKTDIILQSVLPSSTIKRLMTIPDSDLLNKSKKSILTSTSVENGSCVFSIIHNCSFDSEFGFETVRFVDKVFQSYDSVIRSDPSIRKIKSIGAVYLFVDGLNSGNTPLNNKDSNENNNNNILNCCKSMLGEFKKIFDNHKHKLFVKDLYVTFGLSKGSFSAGIVGKSKLLFDVFGKSINLSYRLSQISDKNKIHCEYEGYHDVIEDKSLITLVTNSLKGIGSVNSFYYNI